MRNTYFGDHHTASIRSSGRIQSQGVITTDYLLLNSRLGTMGLRGMMDDPKERKRPQAPKELLVACKVRKYSRFERVIYANR